MNLTAKVLKIDREQTRITTIYEMLGRFGDKLSKGVQDNMREDAENSQKEVDKKMKNLF